jgi:hypothetical protein
MLLLQCPKCKNRMKADPKAGSLTEKKKRCVYCGHTFKIHTSPASSTIIKDNG